MYQLLQGDCLDVLARLPAGSIHCGVTSPAYWGLRDYGHPGQLGLEPTPGEYVDRIVAMFRALRRVLRDDGSLWLNLGDSYAANRGRQVPDRIGRDAGNNRGSDVPAGYKQKDLIGIPWRVAFALQADGWYLRKDIIWAKPNPMPESVTDRPTSSHEYLFLLTKAPNYYYDGVAIEEPAVSDHGSGNGYKRDARLSYLDGDGARGSDRPWVPRSATFARSGPVSEHIIPGQAAAQHRPDHAPPKGRGGKNSFRGQGHFREDDNGPANRDGRDMQDVGSGPTRNKRDVWTVAIHSHRERLQLASALHRNKRDVWTVPVRPYKGAHFATMPVELARLCILAGTSAAGACAKCGAPWLRQVEQETTFEGGSGRAGRSAADANANGKWAGSQYGKNIKLGPVVSTQTLGWEPSSACDAGAVPCTVIDPFSGAGSTGVAAIGAGRDYIGIDLSADYNAQADRRLRGTQPALPFAI